MGASGGELLQCTATLPAGSGKCNSCNALPGCLGAVGTAILAMHCHSPRGIGQWDPCNALPPCLAAVGSATPEVPRGSGQLPHCLRVVGSKTPAMHCHSAWGQWALELLQCSASLHGVSGHWTSYNALPHCLGTA